MSPSAPEWVSITEYAEHYGVHRNTVRKWLEQELLITYRLGTVIRIRNLPPGVITRKLAKRATS